MSDQIAQATAIIESLAPCGAPTPIRTPLSEDECQWFLRAIEARTVTFTDCPPDCFRLKKWGRSGPDHFETPAGKPRHLFSKPDPAEAWLNREYVPHIGAYALAVIQEGYDPAASSFSLYRKFSRDLVTKRAGGGFETDAEFYDDLGAIHLQIEAKASQKQTAALAKAIETYATLDDLPTKAAKEIEYVLDLSPRYLWVVGPGSLDPASYLFKVELTGPTNASFTRIDQFPAPPASGA